MISGEVTVSDIRVGTNSQVPRIGMEAYIPQAVSPVSVIIALMSSFHFPAFSPISLLHVVMGRPYSSCATHFDFLPSLQSLLSFMSSLMLYSHLFLGLSLLLLHCTCIVSIFLVVSSPSFLNTWPYHRSCFCLKKVVIGSMFVLPCLSSSLPLFPFSFNLTVLLTMQSP